jgi:hypothetical protein
VRLLDTVDGGVTSNGITHVPNFVKTGDLVEKLKLGTQTDADTHRQNTAVIVYSFPRRSKSMLKTNLCRVCSVSYRGPNRTHKDMKFTLRCCHYDVLQLCLKIAVDLIKMIRN